jgi:TonB-linked SusC/RagA family outer membrane protein
VLNAQGVQIKGKVTSSEDGSALPGASVVVKGTNVATITDADGNYLLNVPQGSGVLWVSFVGMKTQEVKIEGQTSINVVLQSDVVGLQEVVVTALGISRDKKSLGYATQEIKGDAIATVKTDNFINSISGKVAGVQITRTSNIGGSTNIIIRGSTSLTGNNQALFVVDGVPIDNTMTNTLNQSQGANGYDYGNPASDINADDIESINVLKGAASTALYGSRAANGVVMITTKKGTTNGKKKGIGVSLNSNITVGFVDKSTFPEYQKDYGGGYGKYYQDPSDPNNPDVAGYWYFRDIDPATKTISSGGSKDQWVVTSEDASYGAKFDPNLKVYQWDAVDLQSPNFLKKTPWVAATNGPITLFENPVTYTNTAAIENTLDNGSYRLSFTNFKQNGLMPNSQLDKNNILLNGTWKVTSKLTVTGSGNVIRTDTKGRNATGYNDNIMGSFRQWFQTNVDVKELKDAYFSTHRNVTWNWADPSNQKPIFWDNPYWILYENYETDSRDRFVGNMTANYKITDWLEIFGRASTDFYNGLEEERKAIGTVPGRFGIGTGTAADGSYGQTEVGSGYLRRDIFSREDNYDLMLNLNKNLTDDINLKGILGSNMRRTNYNRMISATNGGLGIDRIYALQNSVNALPYPKELNSKIGVDGIYGNLSLGYKNYLFFDGALRRDHSSTLPVANSIFYYPSISGSVIFSELVQQSWLSFGKVRLNYAEVGNSTGFDNLIDRYRVITPFNSPSSSLSTTKKNPDLKPERTKTIEGGLEMYFLDKRVGFDLALYSTKSIDQIMPLSVSTATGYTYDYINAGELDNKGIELAITVVPIKVTDFTWTMNVNWSKNISKVVSLYTSADGKDTITNYQLGSYQGGITINARVGQPYGELNGSDYTYYNGQKIVSGGKPKTTGQYIKTSTSDNNIGKVSPDWKGGINNTFTYKNWSLGFLVDMQKGGSIFSLDMYYGLATGLYKETSYKNDLGNPVRDPIKYVDPGDPANNISPDPSKGYLPNSGGFINSGVNVTKDANGNIISSSPNKTRIRADRYGAWGYARGLPDIAFVYDATYVKLREMNLTYNFPSSLFQKIFIKGASFSLVGSNLWIIYKKLPYADPESGLGAGNLQGFSTGSLPSTRDFGFDVKLSF